MVQPHTLTGPAASRLSTLTEPATRQAICLCSCLTLTRPAAPYPYLVTRSPLHTGAAIKLSLDLLHADAASYWTRYTHGQDYTMCSRHILLLDPQPPDSTEPNTTRWCRRHLSLDPLHAGAAATLGVVLVYRDVGESLTTHLQKGSNSRFTPPPL
jgi:hypothetical protein